MPGTLHHYLIFQTVNMCVSLSLGIIASQLKMQKEALAEPTKEGTADANENTEGGWPIFNKHLL